MGNYDDFAIEYTTHTEEKEEQVREHFYSLLPKELNGKKILDVACGSGQDAQYYAKKGAIVYGIDKSEKQIEIVNNKTVGSFFIADMNTLPFEDDFFDFVTSVYALQTSNDVPMAINEMIRVAKKGSTILISTKHPIRNFLEGYVNDGKFDYYEKRNVTSYIFNRSIKLIEPGHTMSEYLHSSILERATIELFEEHTDFPASEQVIKGLNYPTFMIVKFIKK